MSDLKRLLRFLVFEGVVFVSVLLAFRVIEEKLIAGMIGGVLFVSLGMYVCWHCRKSDWLKSSPTFFAGLAHLFLTSLPMIVARLLNPGVDFKEVKILGLPGPMFHGFSSTVFLILVAATAIDLFRVYRASQRKPPVHERKLYSVRK
ncbi:MAG: hypothetical protein V4692_04810 [Bdellovibrionota bacterium]